MLRCGGGCVLCARERAAAGAGAVDAGTSSTLAPFSKLAVLFLAHCLVEFMQADRVLEMLLGMLFKRTHSHNLQVSRTVAAGIVLPPGAVLLAAIAGVGVHLVYLALNVTACRCLCVCVCVCL